jgi:hypothetical protein
MNRWREIAEYSPSLRAKRSNPALLADQRKLDCFVAPLLAMTANYISGSRAETDRWGRRRAAAAPINADSIFRPPMCRPEGRLCCAFLISNKSSSFNARTLFVDADHMAGIVRG